jgi:hypothetical protein
MWFDRDDVSVEEALNPFMVDGGTYNTNGRYDVAIDLHATDATSGEATMTVNQLEQGFEADDDPETMELAPAGMTFTGDMSQMQVFYGMFGFGATHEVKIEEITVTGCQGEISYCPNFLGLRAEDRYLNNTSMSN